MDPELYKLIQQAVTESIRTTQIISALITLVVAGLGAGLGSYFSKRGEFVALKDDFKESLRLELQKTRGVERQELRYRSYALLRKELRPLAIYDESVINKRVVGKLNKSLSDWYFSENGGLLLTPQARDFYFALQDLLRLTFRIVDKWEVNRSKASERMENQILMQLLKQFADGKNKELPDEPSDVLQYFTQADFKDWNEQAPMKGKAWRRAINEVAQEWKRLNNEQRFATLQQVGSILRTSLTNDLESRLG